MKARFPAMLGLLALLLSSCLPEQRLWWSPDGKVAIIHANDGLRTAMADGTLGPTIDLGGDPDGSMPDMLAWLPDGSAVVCVRSRRIGKWEDVRALVPEEESVAVEALARAIPHLTEAFAAASAPSNSLKNGFDLMPVKNTPWLLPAAQLAYKSDPKTISKLLARFDDTADLLTSLNGDDGNFLVHELCILTRGPGGIPGSPRVLVASLRNLGNLKVSPSGTHLAMFRVGTEENTHDLIIRALTNSTESIIASNSGCQAYCWTPDSTALVTILPKHNNSEVMTISRVPIGERGDKQSTPPSQLLTESLMTEPPRLKVLADGRILFAGIPQNLPALSPTTPPAPCLFLLSADGTQLERIKVPDTTTLPKPDHFIASPDGKLIALVEAKGCAVSVLDTATGKVTELTQAIPGWSSHTLPCWKNNTELFFAATPEGYPGIMHWIAGEKPTPWSKSWPAAVTSNWLSADSE